MASHIETVPQTDHRLGRHLEHDTRSRAFALPVTIDRSTWHDKFNRIYDPRPNPNQPVGCCTMCAKAMQLNAAGNRRTGPALDLNWALDGYVWETHNDEFPGAWNRDGSGQDTGSSGLASCKTAQHLGIGGEYRWIFAGADAVIQAVMDGLVISVGTWWYNDMFESSGGWFHNMPIVNPTGGKAGGHQYVIRGYDQYRDRAVGRCWWGPGFRDFWITRTNLDHLLRDGGDAHHQKIVL